MVEAIQHNKSNEALMAFGESLQETAQSDAWMAACWRVKDGRIELVRTTTYQFPNGDVIAAVGHLALQLFEMTKEEKLPDEPLPMADLPWLPPVKETEPVIEDVLNKEGDEE
jgi:hypothetical protein